MMATSYTIEYFIRLISDMDHVDVDKLPDVISPNKGENSSKWVWFIGYMRYDIVNIAEGRYPAYKTLSTPKDRILAALKWRQIYGVTP